MLFVAASAMNARTARTRQQESSRSASKASSHANDTSSDASSDTSEGSAFAGIDIKYLRDVYRAQLKDDATGKEDEKQVARRAPTTQDTKRRRESTVMFGPFIIRR